MGESTLKSRKNCRPLDQRRLSTVSCDVCTSDHYAVCGHFALSSHRWVAQLRLLERVSRATTSSYQKEGYSKARCLRAAARGTWVRHELEQYGCAWQ